MKSQRTAKFDKAYLKRIDKETFLKEHEHLSDLPLSDIWDQENPKSKGGKPADQPKAEQEK